MITVTITRYRKGIISVPQLITPILNSGAVPLTIQYNGSARLVFNAAVIDLYRNLALRPNIEIQDDSDTNIIGTDNLGHINDLARIDCALQYVDDANIINIQPAMALLSGGTAQPDGTVDSVGSETLIFSLSGLYPLTMGGQLARIAKFRIDITTPNDTTYVTSCEVFRIERDNPVEYSQQAYPADIGNGTTGHAYAENVITSPFTQLQHTHLKVITVITAGTLTITQIQMYLDMDT